jgi:hypothetical protein
MNSTKIVRAFLALSLAANLALGWMLWRERQHPVHSDTRTISASPTKAMTQLEPQTKAPAQAQAQNPALTQIQAQAQATPVSAVESAIPRAPRIEPPLPPSTRAGMTTNRRDAALFLNPVPGPAVDPSKLPAYLKLERPERKAYGPPLPPNPYAAPPWEERLPYREDQFKRGLYSVPLKLDK